MAKDPVEESGRGHGLVIGKFLPPHAGHLALLERAGALSETATAILFSKQDEPIPGDVRVEWLKRLVPANVTVVHNTDELPVDYDDLAVWDLWMTTIRASLSAPITTVFSSETYGEELAKRLGAEHVLVDPERASLPVSGTAIRTDPLGNWQYLPAPVRGWYARRVAIIGPESSGKSTLARTLAERFNTTVAPEFARDYLVAKLPEACTLDDIEVIAREQVALEDRLAETCNGYLFADTDLRTTRAWSEHYFGTCPESVMALLKTRHYFHVLLLAPVLDWEDDGLRDCPDPKVRQHFFDRFKRELTEEGVPFTVIDETDLVARIETAVRAILGLGR